MEIITAKSSDLGTVYDIAQSTIKAIYPHFYPAGAVEFFLVHHSREHISADIEAGRVSIAVSDGRAVGTVTVSGDSINRLFVLPDEQGNGFGGELLRFAEAEIAKSYGTARLDSSLPAKQIYLKKGYMVIDSRTIEAGGDFLCYDIMIKRVASNAD
ncbi:MAG: GNAT family N-acetyltransferase [Ruminococcus sp.]|nr:GNAT family N-acetyltransferase [Ruminococcus sp.]